MQFELKIDKHEKYGYTITTPTTATKEFCKKYKYTKIMIHRTTEDGKKGKGDGEKKKSSTRKYICPKCKNSFRATKEINCICKECMVDYELAQ